MFRWLRPLLRPKQFERELTAELLFHLDQQTAAYQAEGLSEPEARRRARLDLGGLAHAQEETRMARRSGVFFEIGRDFQFGLRMIRKNPALAAIAIASLALGIGANTAIYSVVHSVLVRELPYADSRSLISVGIEPRKDPSRFDDRSSPALFQEWRSSISAFAGAAALHETYEVNLTGGAQPERLDTQLVTGEFFPLLGVKPVLGRWLTPEDDRPGHETVAVLAHSLWVSRFGAREDVVGQTIELDTRSHTIVGVMPAGFQFRNPNASLWRPFGWGPAGDASPVFYTRTFARLKPGATLGQARGELAAAFQSFGQKYGDLFEEAALSARPLREHLTSGIQPLMIVLLCGVGFVLLIACANVANLLLARAAARQPETEIRAALGASRARLIRQHLSESLVLSFSGCLFGVLLAYAAVPGLVHFIPEAFPRREEIGIDAAVLAVSVAASILTGLLFGIFPAIAGSRAQGGVAGRASGQRLHGGRFSHRARQILAGVQVAAALVLLAGCGLMIRTFWALEHTDLGFEPDGVYTFQVRLARDRYTSPAGELAAIDAAVAPAFERVLERVRALPGVASATAITWLPMNGFWSERRFFRIEGRAPAAGEQPPGGGYNPISTDFLRTFGVRLVRGREFTGFDSATAPWVALVNESAARQFWKNQDPIGARIKLQLDDRPRLVVGIVADVKHYQVQEETGASPQIYVPHVQQAPNYPWNRVRGRTHMSFAVRSTARPNWEPAFRAAAAAVDKDMPVYAVYPMRHFVAAREWLERFYLTLLSIFAGVALALASIGVYGVINYSVARRTREIGVRMALGARPRDAVRVVLREGALVAGCGVLVGLGLAYWLTRFLQGYLFGVQATDLPTFAAVAVCLAAVALAASYLPARKASRIDPLSALRTE